MRHVYRIALLAMVFVALASGLAASQSVSQQFCSNMFPVESTASMGSLVGVSFAIILVMLSVIGITYMLGYAFQINSLLAFSKTEIGEIALTVVIVAVFSAFIFAANSSSNALLPGVSPTASHGYFASDCNYLSVASVNVFKTIAVYYWPNQLWLSLIQGVGFSYQPAGVGPSFSPFVGIDMITSMVNKFATFAGFIAILPLGVVALLSIIYSLFPLFLYAGIVLRTIPFTRAAGGAFLGFFIGFYLLFPAVLYFMMSAYSANVALVGTAPQSFSAGLPIVFGTDVTIGSSLYDAINKVTTVNVQTQVQNFTTMIIDPAFYAIFAIVISAILAFNFSETIGGLLGAPSLSSRNMLRRIL